MIPYLSMTFYRIYFRTWYRDGAVLALRLCPGYHGSPTCHVEGHCSDLPGKNFDCPRATVVVGYSCLLSLVGDGISVSIHTCCPCQVFPFAFILYNILGHCPSGRLSGVAYAPLWWYGTCGIHEGCPVILLVSQIPKWVNLGILGHFRALHRTFSLSIFITKTPLRQNLHPYSTICMD